jgi:hypothetical protein
MNIDGIKYGIAMLNQGWITNEEKFRVAIKLLNYPKLITEEEKFILEEILLTEM